jgi:hypothetical protein
MAERKKHYPLPRRFNAAVTEAAYERLRALSERYGLSNNYCLTVLLEHLDEIAGEDRLQAAFRAFRDEHC